MRLIDADSLLVNMDKGMQGIAREYLKFYQMAVNDEPITYNVDRVVEQLENSYINCYTIGDYKYNNAIDKAIEIVKLGLKESCEGKMEFMNRQGWIPADKPPRNNKYILISFENFLIPQVGRYEEDEEGGAFYVGDDDESCISQELIVNAWQPLPESYKEV